MKVCTDACLFGAWVTEIIQKSKIKNQNILDIGTGTGLLSLMMAQKTDADIDAVEMDEEAAEQAKNNFAASSWKERLHIHHSDAREFKALHRYDLIISNPPFFESYLKSNDAKKNLALHSEALTLEELMKAIKNNLTPNECFAVLLPAHRSVYFEKMVADNGFYLQNKTMVRQTPRHDPFRSMLFFSTKKTQVTESTIIIKNEEDQYTKEFTELLKDYYLYL